MKLVLIMEEQDTYEGSSAVLDEIKDKMEADYDEITDYTIVAKDNGGQ